MAVRKAVAFLYARAAEMNDPKAKRLFELAADDIGQTAAAWRRKDMQG